MVVPKKVYVQAGLEKTRTRSRGANAGGRRRSFPFPFRSSAGDDSSISTNSYMNEEDDLQPVFQDVADALYKNTSPFMETTLIDFPKIAKSEDDDEGGIGDNDLAARRRKERRITIGRRSAKPTKRPELTRPLLRDARHVGPTNMGVGARPANGKLTKAKDQPNVDTTLGKTYAPNIFVTDKFSFESDEPIATERRDASVSVRTEELVNGKYIFATRPPSPFPNTNASQNRQQPTQRSSLPHNKPRRAKEASTRETTNPVIVHMPTNRNVADDTVPPHSDAVEVRNTEMPRSQSANSKKAPDTTSKLNTNVGRAAGFVKSRSWRGRSPANLETIPAFSKSDSSRGRLFGLFRSVSRNRSRSRDRERAASASSAMPSLPPSQQKSIVNAPATVKSTIKLQPATDVSQAAVDVVTLEILLAHIIREGELFAGFAKELGSLWSCSNWFEPANCQAAVDSRNDASTEKDTIDRSEQTCEKREENSEEKDTKVQETSTTDENPPPSPSNVTPMDGLLSYMNLLIAATKQHLAMHPSKSTTTIPSVLPLSTASLASATGSVPTITTTAADQVSSPPPNNATAAAAPSTSLSATAADRDRGLPPLCPQKPTKRIRSGNLQMLRVRFRRDSSFGTRSGSSRTSESTRSLFIED